MQTSLYIICASDFGLMMIKPILPNSVFEFLLDGPEERVKQARIFSQCIMWERSHRLQNAYVFKAELTNDLYDEVMKLSPLTEKIIALEMIRKKAISIDPLTFNGKNHCTDPL